MNDNQEKKLDDIHLAVVGNDHLGVPGLVKEVSSLKSWRKRLDLRIATISGGVVAVVAVVKYVMSSH